MATSPDVRTAHSFQHDQALNSDQALTLDRHAWGALCGWLSMTHLSRSFNDSWLCLRRAGQPPENCTKCVRPYSSTGAKRLGLYLAAVSVRCNGSSILHRRFKRFSELVHHGPRHDVSVRALLTQAPSEARVRWLESLAWAWEL